MVRTGFQHLLAGIVRLYQIILSPLFPQSCRFYPSCSEYARQSLMKHGPFKGLYRAVARLLKCHPFHPGGVDLP